MGRPQTHAGIHLDIQANGQALAQTLDRDMMDRHPSMRGNQQNAFQHALLVQSHGNGGQGQIDLRVKRAGRIKHLIADPGDAVMGCGAGHADGGFRKEIGAARPDSQRLDFDNTGNPFNRLAQMLAGPVGSGIDQRINGPAA